MPLIYVDAKRASFPRVILKGAQEFEMPKITEFFRKSVNRRNVYNANNEHTFKHLFNYKYGE